MTIRRLCTTFLAAAVLLIGATAAPAAATAPTVPSNLPWFSARTVADGVPAQFTSIRPCPTTRPDGSPLQGTLMVFVTVTFSNGGGAMTQGPVFPDASGNWSAALTYNAGGFRDLGATVSATCQDVTFFGTIIGQYKAHAIDVNP
jgi:hypothetical protein